MILTPFRVPDLLQRPPPQPSRQVLFFLPQVILRIEIQASAGALLDTAAAAAAGVAP